MQLRSGRNTSSPPPSSSVQNQKNNSNNPKKRKRSVYEPKCPLFEPNPITSKKYKKSRRASSSFHYHQTRYQTQQSQRLLDEIKHNLFILKEMSSSSTTTTTTTTTSSSSIMKFIISYVFVGFSSSTNQIIHQINQYTELFLKLSKLYETIHEHFELIYYYASNPNQNNQNKELSQVLYFVNQNISHQLGNIEIIKQTFVETIKQTRQNIPHIHQLCSVLDSTVNILHKLQYKFAFSEVDDE